MALLGIWQETGLPWNASVREVKHAYAALIKRYRPDSHPREFSDARLAYEAALRIAELRERRSLVQPATTASDAPFAESAAPSVTQPLANTSFAPEIPAPEDPLAFLTAPFSAAPMPDAEPATTQPVKPSMLASIPPSTSRARDLPPPNRELPPIARAASSSLSHAAPGRSTVGTLLDALFLVVDADGEPQQIAEAFQKAMQALRDAPVDDVLEFEDRLTERVVARATPCWALMICADEAFGWRTAISSRVPAELLECCQAAPRLLPSLVTGNRWVRGLFSSGVNLPRVISARSSQALQATLLRLRAETAGAVRSLLDRQFEASSTRQALSRLMLYSTDLLAAVPPVLIACFIALITGWGEGQIAALAIVALTMLAALTCSTRFGWQHPRTKGWATKLAGYVRDHPAFKPPFILIGIVLYGIVVGTVATQISAQHFLLSRVLFASLGLILGLPAACLLILFYFMWWRVIARCEADILIALDRVEAVKTQTRVNRFMAVAAPNKTQQPVRFWDVQKQFTAQSKQQATLRAAQVVRTQKKSETSGMFAVVFLVIVGLSALVKLVSGDNGAPGPQHSPVQATQPPAPAVSGSVPKYEFVEPNAPPPMYFRVSDQFCGRAQLVRTNLTDQARRADATTGIASLTVQLGPAGVPELKTLMTSNAFLIESGTALASRLDCPASAQRLGVLNLSFNKPSATPQINPLASPGHDGWLIVEELHGSKAPPEAVKALHLAASQVQADFNSQGTPIFDLVNFQPTDLPAPMLRMWMHLRGADHALVLRLDGTPSNPNVVIRAEPYPALPRVARTASATSPACRSPAIWPMVPGDMPDTLKTTISETVHCIRPAAQPR